MIVERFGRFGRLIIAPTMGLRIPLIPSRGEVPRMRQGCYSEFMDCHVTLRVPRNDERRENSEFRILNS